MKVQNIVQFVLILMLFAACRQVTDPMPTIPAPPLVAATAELSPESPQYATDNPTDVPRQQPSPASISYGYTNHRADGNRLALGTGRLPDAEHVDIPLDGKPLWLVAAPIIGESNADSASIWVSVLADGRSQAFVVEDGSVIEMTRPQALSYPIPPLLRVNQGHPELLVSPIAQPGQAPPAILGETGNWVYTDASGDLVFVDSNVNVIGRLPVHALADGRILVDEDNRLLLLTQPTDRYGHGVLGDSIEAAAITLVETEPEPAVVLTIVIPEIQVVEGLAPLWVDLTGDGRREIIVTISDETQGAQIVVFDESGDQLASGPVIGQGYRWRHQLAVAPFGPDGEIELVDVLTPHIGGVVEFYRLTGDELSIVARVPGFTSHVIGYRNLDMGIAGDFDADGNLELLLPNQSRTSLGAIRRFPGGAEEVWNLELDGRLSSNLAVVSTGVGRLILGAGREDGVLRLWP